MSLRVVIADDQAMVRSGFRMILETQGVTVVGEAGDGQTAVDLARRLRPDVCLLDIRMPIMDGLEATRLLAGPDVADPIAVVVVTTFDMDDYVRTAIRNGASGFLLKDAGPTLLLEAVRAAAAGDALVSPSITVRFLQHYATLDAGHRDPGSDRAGVDTPQSREPRVALTEREEDVVREIARGRTNAEIGAELFISLSTTKTHVANIQTKLGARNRVEIASWAWHTGRVS